MGHLAFGAVIQWVILHEIGHHQLNHFDKEPQNLVENRKRELAADTWAIQKMQYLGYCLDPLLAVMLSFQIEEEMKRNAGLIIPVRHSTHPSWNQRVVNLKRFETDKPSNFGNFISILEISTELITGKAYANELWIPRRPMPGFMCQYNQFGHNLQMPLEFLTDGSIHIYGRTNIELSEIIVTNLSSLNPDIKFKYTNLNTGQISESYTRGYQMDIGSLMSSSVKGLDLLIRDVLQADPESYFKEFLLAVESRSEVINQVLKLQKQLLSEMNTVRLMYAKGKISMQSGDQMAQQIVTEKTEEMRQLLGDNKFRLMQEKMLANPVTALALQKLLK